MAPKPKKIILRTPEGVARYSHVHKADTDGKFADNKFKTDIVFDGDVDLAVLTDGALAAAAVFYPGLAASKVNVLIKEGDTLTDKENKPIPEVAGKRLLTAKSKFAVKVVGPDKQDLPDGVEVRGGDIIRLLVEPVESPKPVKNSVSWRLHAVQLIKKREGGGHDYTDMFEDEGEGFGAPAAGGTTGEPAEDDDLPF